MKSAASYSPTWCRSTIGAGELNFSVRDGKRWILTAITAYLFLCTPVPFHSGWRHISLRETPKYLFTLRHFVCLLSYEAFGLLVQIGFDIAAFTPSAYQRGSLPRPSWKSHLEAGFALRCFQRLSLPNVDTRRCGWRHNR